MESRSCPKCNKKISNLDEVCPKCGEMLFDDPVVVTKYDNQKKEKLERYIDDKLLDINIAILRKIKGIRLIKLISNSKFVKKIKRNSNNITTNIVYGWSRLAEGIKLDKIYPYCTYINALCVAIIVSTCIMIMLGIKIVKFSDTKSTLSKVTSKTTYEDITTMEQKKPKRSLNFQRGVIVLTYENQNYGGVEVTMQYEVSPKDNLLKRTLIKFDSNEANILNMRQYLEVNYGKGKKLDDGSISYSDDENRYSYTNGTREEKEVVEIIPLDIE